MTMTTMSMMITTTITGIDGLDRIFRTRTRWQSSGYRQAAGIGRQVFRTVGGLK